MRRLLRLSRSGENHGIGTNRESEASYLEALMQMLDFPQGVISQVDQSDQNVNPQIFEVPLHIRERNSSAYEPKSVSMGPYHYGKAHLMPMQEHKKRALNRFLYRHGVPVESYREELMAVVDELRKTYRQLDQMPPWKDNNNLFVNLMMLDGVFLLEFLSVKRGTQSDQDYDQNDNIFGRHGCILSYDALMEDLLLLENQLPYKVLYILRHVSKGELVRDANENDADYGRRKQEREKDVISSLEWLMFNDTGSQSNHFLDSYQNVLLTRSELKIPASKLDKYGIQFEAVDDYRKMGLEESRGTLIHTAHYWSTKKRTLKLRPVVINERTVPAFLNLKAYELNKGSNQQEWISYFHLMDALVQSVEDIILLESQGIIFCSLASYEDVHGVIKELKKDATVNSDSNSNRVLEKVHKFYEQKKKSKRTQIRARLATLEVIAGLILLLTMFQAVYAYLSYKKPENKS